MKYKNKSQMLAILNKMFNCKRATNQDSETFNEILNCPIEDLDQIIAKEVELLTNPPKESEK